MNNQVLNTYFKESGLSLDQMKEKVSPNFELFLKGDKDPSFNQLLKIAKQFDIPVGLLLLDKPVKKSISEMKFRTINSEYKARVSSELNDTISEMQEKQDFLKEQIGSDLDFVGKFSIKDNYKLVANFIEKELNLTPQFYLKITKNNYFKFLRSKINELGIFVFLNGKVKDNTHRPLSIEEFRGFVLLDNKAPIIFINQKDTKNGQVFTLIHELTHIFIGDEEILGQQDNFKYYDKTEAFVNKVTAEILVPEEDFKKQLSTKSDLQDLANYFKVSKYVIARRMKDLKIISSKEYRNIVLNLDKQFKEYENLFSTKHDGGDYRNNLNFRVDHNFFKYVENALNNQSISYTDAFNIIGVGYKGFQILRKG